jgi:hypothetical protein
LVFIQNKIAAAILFPQAGGGLRTAKRGCEKIKSAFVFWLMAYSRVLKLLIQIKYDIKSKI